MPKLHKRHDKMRERPSKKLPYFAKYTLWWWSEAWESLTSASSRYYYDVAMIMIPVGPLLCVVTIDKGSNGVWSTWYCSIEERLLYLEINPDDLVSRYDCNTSTSSISSSPTQTFFCGTLVRTLYDFPRQWIWLWFPELPRLEPDQFHLKSRMSFMANILLLFSTFLGHSHRHIGVSQNTLTRRMGG